MSSFALRGLTLLAILALTILTGVPGAAGADSGSRLLLYPDIHEDFVVFVHGQDIWRAPADGGPAFRLTSHAGAELFPKISPDGSRIAFSAEYSGTRQVWVMPAAGGEPRQLTFYADVGEMPPRGGYDYWVLGWTPENKILVLMNRTPWGERMGRYFLVDPEGGLEQPLEIQRGGTASYSADGQRLAYTPIDREFRTWKRSVGGRAQDIWTYDFENKQSHRLTDFRGTDNFPMWVDDRIYFTSDRSYTLNLFAIDPTGQGEARQITDFDTWDVLWPSLGPSHIVFMQGGDLAKLDLATETVSTIDITFHGVADEAVPRFEDASDNVQSAAISPSGKRVVVDARGDLFSVPVEHGATRNLTSTAGTRERDPAWSPDGKWIAYLSDASGEYEIYLLAQDGKSEPRRLTEGGKAWKFLPTWSPDSKSLAFADRDRNLYVLDVESGEQTLVDRGFRGDLRTHVFSPDGRWLAYERVVEATRLVGISLFSLEEKKSYRLGDGLSADHEPAWSHDGKYLFFLSDRNFIPTFSSFEFDFLYNQSTRIYVAALDAEAPALFPLRSDEEPAESEPESADGGDKGDKGDKEKKSEASPKKKTLKLDPEGFMARTVALPNVGPSNYGSLQASENAVFFIETGDGPPALKMFDMESRKVETVASPAMDFDLAAGGKKLLYVAPGGAFHVVDAKPGANGQGRLDLSSVRLKIDPRVEWQQMFDDAWRITRDWFYDPEMHGMDWQALGERYGKLVPRIAHRSELDWILGELVGELGAGHTYVQSGETESVPRIDGGMLGAELEADASGYYRVSRVLQGENWHEDFRSPLTEPGSEVAEGELILAIDGHELRTDDNPYRLLEGKGEQLVVLTVSKKPSFDSAREVTVRAISSEQRLRYIDWVKSRMALVDELSGGRIGYIHLPDTAFSGSRMLQKLFFGQAEKEALIVDDRYNGGGFIPDRMISYLERDNLAYWAMRGIDSMRTPAFAHDGPKVMLVNGYSSSGGDALPYFFRSRGLGKLIGTRTWGGLIGLNGNPPLADGGAVSICTFRIYDSEGNWVVENEGVVPDIEVFDQPEAFLDGGDPSIEAAVQELLQQLESRPVSRPTVPKAPDLSRSAFPSSTLGGKTSGGNR